MKIYDCFTYYNEEEILKIRLNELSNFVEKFVIVEASQTFTGKKKPYYLDDVLDSLKDEWKEKICIYRVEFPDQDLTSWQREHIQRNYIAEALKHIGVSEKDLVVISDADEIWNPKRPQENVAR